MDHPLGQVLAAASALGNAKGGAAAQPEIGQAGYRPQQGRPVRRVGYGAVDHALDPRIHHVGHAVHGPFQPGHDAVQVIGEQLAI